LTIIYTINNFEESVSFDDGSVKRMFQRVMEVEILSFHVNMVFGLDFAKHNVLHKIDNIS